MHIINTTIIISGYKYYVIFFIFFLLIENKNRKHIPLATLYFLQYGYEYEYITTFFFNLAIQIILFKKIN